MTNRLRVTPRRPPWSRWRGLPALAMILVSCSMPDPSLPPSASPACAFLAWTNFSSFARHPGPHPRAEAWLSPEILAPSPWTELVASWNAPPTTALAVEARALAEGWTSRYFHLGQWSLDPARFPRRSFQGQKDADGEVQTDILALARPARGVQVRVTLEPIGRAPISPLKFLGLSLVNTALPPPARSPNRAAWGRVLSVPFKSQRAYASGRDWCSPTCVAMVLGYWSALWGRPELAIDVPVVAQHSHDPTWGGTGNWSFNTAYAGSLPGMRAYVARLPGLAEVEDCIAAGVPVVMSVDFNRLHDQAQGQGSGHLVVCIGFTDSGEVIVHDPWVSPDRPQDAPRIHPRARVLAAWARSRQTVYLIHPDTLASPLAFSQPTPARGASL